MAQIDTEPLKMKDNNKFHDFISGFLCLTAGSEELNPSTGMIHNKNRSERH
jgi:hypothetical protein